MVQNLAGDKTDDNLDLDDLIPWKGESGNNRNTRSEAKGNMKREWGMT
jgi:hypothetical protein